ncbi:hypothetical protein CDL15_Pgr003953 [Punica granatum]|uniref:Uncharacterized protein n=1 Tax=Punica granatum TaxID=22663 RepID=A0A218WQ21_PUNGR|nr:hypothetical protein CDL15_Pgr003953 [Punica granatum]
MHKEKSRGRGLESRKTRLGRYGLRDPRGDNRGRSGKTRSARLLRSRHGARSGSLDSLGVNLGVRERSQTCRSLDKPEIVR